MSYYRDDEDGWDLIFGGWRGVAVVVALALVRLAFEGVWASLVALGIAVVGGALLAVLRRKR